MVMLEGVRFEQSIMMLKMESVVSVELRTSLNGEKVVGLFGIE